MASYKGLKVSQLKELLAEKGLSQTGRKASLLERLVEFEASQPQTESFDESSETAEVSADSTGTNNATMQDEEEDADGVTEEGSAGAPAELDAEETQEQQAQDQHDDVTPMADVSDVAEVATAVQQESGDSEPSAKKRKLESNGTDQSTSSPQKTLGDDVTTTTVTNSKAEAADDVTKENNTKETAESDSEDDDSPPTESEMREMLQGLSHEKLLEYAEKLACAHLDSPEVLELAQSAANDPTKCKVFVRSIPFDANGDHLKRIFNKFGKIIEAFIIKERDGRSKGFGFVQFSKMKYAQRALDADVVEVLGREVHCSLATAKPDRASRNQRRSYGGGGGYNRYGGGGYGGGYGGYGGGGYGGGGYGSQRGYGGGGGYRY